MFRKIFWSFIGLCLGGLVFYGLTMNVINSFKEERAQTKKYHEYLASIGLSPEEAANATVKQEVYVPPPLPEGFYGSGEENVTGGVNVLRKGLDR